MKEVDLCQSVGVPAGAGCLSDDILVRLRPDRRRWLGTGRNARHLVTTVPVP
jgi:hypothetical protein